MIDGLRVLALITARGESKGLPGKNLRSLNGRPLVAWSVVAAQQSTYVDRIVISSDSHDIISAAVEAGAEAPFVRPPELAADDTGSVSVVLDVLDRLPEFDLVVLLQPTSPLRTSNDIDTCLVTCVEGGAPSVLTITETSTSPYSAFRMGEDRRLARLLDRPESSIRRQDLPLTYNVNGAVYVVRVPWFRREKTFITAQTMGCIMPSERSIDIDTLLDFRIAEMIMMNKKITPEEQR
jgi:CMP-N,N'-diacetyllegionaminic acid synthase